MGSPRSCTPRKILNKTEAQEYQFLGFIVMKELLSLNLTCQHRVCPTKSDQSSPLPPSLSHKCSHAFVKVGGAAASWLGRSIPEREVQVQVVAGDTVLCS